MDWNRVLDRMKLLDMSMYRLSIELGKDSGQVKNWVSRGTTPQGDSLVRMAKILGVRVEYFFPDEYPKIAQHSERRRRFYSWVDDMSEDDMEGIENLFKVLGEYGAKLGGERKPIDTVSSIFNPNKEDEEQTPEK